MSSDPADKPFDSAKFVEEMFKLAQANPGQPGAVIDDGEGLKIGVLGSFEPERDDWMLNPVSVEHVVQTS